MERRLTGGGGLGGRSRAVLLTPQGNYPRFHHNAAALLEAGFAVTAYTFSRPVAGGSSFPEGVEVVDLGFVPHRRYAARSYRLVRGFLRVWKSERRRVRPDVICATGLDLAILGNCVFKLPSRLVYEVGDLRLTPDTAFPGHHIVRYLEDKVIRSCGLLTVTAPGFVNEYYEDRCPGIWSRTVVVENAIPLNVARSLERPTSCSWTRKPVRLGYIGRIRYPSTLYPLIQAVQQAPEDFELLVYGDGPYRHVVEDAAAESSNVHYFGPFKNPDDLAAIYRSIDCCYVVYDNQDFNVRVALPNKLYESVFFGIPLIVAQDTALADKIREWGVGWIVDPRHSGAIERLLSSITPAAVDEKKAAVVRVDRDRVVEDRRQWSHRIKQMLS